MKTPVEYTNNLKKGIITKNMLECALYSCNKRAKNYRDNENRYSQKQHISNNVIYYRDKNKEKKEELYKYKEILLSIVEPDCIHKEKFNTKQKVRIYDYEDVYYTINDEAVINENEYFDRDIGGYVCFKDILINKPIENYYLFYNFNNSSFHIPIGFSDLSKYENLEIVEIGQLITNGNDIADLLSIQFVKKIIELIENNNYEYQA